METNEQISLSDGLLKYASESRKAGDGTHVTGEAAARGVYGSPCPLNRGPVRPPPSCFMLYRINRYERQIPESVGSSPLEKINIRPSRRQNASSPSARRTTGGWRTLDKAHHCEEGPIYGQYPYCRASSHPFAEIFLPEGSKPLSLTFVDNRKVLPRLTDGILINQYVMVLLGLGKDTSTFLCNARANQSELEGGRSRVSAIFGSLAPGHARPILLYSFGRKVKL